MITNDGNNDRKLEEMVGQGQADELMHINLPADKKKNAPDVNLSEFGPEAGKPPETIEEKIKEWAHDVAGSDAQADEILGQDDRKVQHSTDMAEHIMDLPEGLDTLLDPAADDTSSVAEMHVVQFQGD